MCYVFLNKSTNALIMYTCITETFLSLWNKSELNMLCRFALDVSFNSIELIWIVPCAIFNNTHWTFDTLELVVFLFLIVTSLDFNNSINFKNDST